MGVRLRLGLLRLVSAAAIASTTTTCANLDWTQLCPPVDGRVGFLSRGDCVFLRNDVFSGHEWLTLFGNEDIPEGEARFTDEEIGLIQEGNRRVDFPLELLVHLNNGALAYINALTEYHDRAENQPVHFLLNDRNDSSEASAASHALVRTRTREAVALWDTDRVRALTLIGQVTHCIQDSFSAAHTTRDPGHPDKPWCVEKVKAYMPRAAGFLTPDIEFHGGQGDDTVGHATPLDSITRAGRRCRAPETRARVRECLSATAMVAKEATTDYLRRVLQYTRAGEVDEADLAAYIEARLTLCDA